MRWIVLLWLMFVAALSAVPYSIKTRLGTNGPFHGLGHLLIFLITGVLVSWTAVGLGSKLGRFAGVCAFALALEALETQMYGNAFEWRDAGMDIVGAAIGAAAVSLLPLLFAEFQRRSVSPEQ